MRFIISEEDRDRRLDLTAAERTNMTRSAVVKLIEQNAITVNFLPITKKYLCRPGDVVDIVLPEPKELEIKAENIPINIVYEDDDLLIVNKPKGMVVHPAPGNYEGTLVNALMYHCKDRLSSINGVIRPGIVHRIDKNTSGLLIIAKNDESHNLLAEQIKEHSFTRKYEAIVCGAFREDSGVIDAPIGRHPVDRKKMAVVSDGRDALTLWNCIARYNGYTHLGLELKTGRTHQIRVHMSHKNHPVFGDDVYGAGKTVLEREFAKIFEGQCLHARSIGFVHPRSGEYMYFESELPEYFVNLKQTLEKRN